jgi:hypothetical protein
MSTKLVGTPSRQFDHNGNSQLAIIVEGLEMMAAERFPDLVATKAKFGPLLICVTVAVAMFGLQLIHFVCTLPNAFDEGNWLVLLTKVSSGSTPYMDFQTDYGPLYLMFAAQVTRLFDNDLLGMRMVLGMVQGVASFCVLAWSLGRQLRSITLGLVVSIIVGVSAAHPTIDSTMYWGFRYYVGLLILAPLIAQMSGVVQLSSFTKHALFAGFGCMLLYSGEAGTACAPVLILFLLHEMRRGVAFKSILLMIGICWSGIILSFFFVGRSSLLYLHHLYWIAPTKYAHLRIMYPSLSLEGLHYYVPFAVILVAVVAAYQKPKYVLPLLAGSLALSVIMKVATTRSDSPHLAYAYPYVLALMAVVWTAFFPEPTELQSPKSGKRFSHFAFMTLVSAALIGFVREQDFKTYFDRIGLFLRDRAEWGIEPAWRIRLPANELAVLVEARSIFREHADLQKSTFVFPFQPILYSQLGISAPGVDTIRNCTTFVDRTSCASTFNGVLPAAVVWVPEGTLFSWPFDGTYASFDFPDSFAALRRDFYLPISLGRTGWLLFLRKSSNELDESVDLTPLEASVADWEQCHNRQCAFLSAITKASRLEDASLLACFSPKPEVKRELLTSPQVSLLLPASGFEPRGSSPTWLCKNVGTPNCVCSRAHVEKGPNGWMSRWAWDGFAREDIDKSDELALFIDIRS